jgi:hypothetical protein
MPKFRKKPVVIEATQFRNESCGAFNLDGWSDPPGVTRLAGRPYVVTIHNQRCFIEVGDWIIPEPDGVHFYPVKPDIFAATYEPVDD